MSEAEEYLKQAYEDEDFMEEARTNEEMYEDQILQAQALMGKLKGLENGSAFFNDECYDQESNQSSGDSQEQDDDEEDGEFNPNMNAQVLVDGDEY